MGSRGTALKNPARHECVGLARSVLKPHIPLVTSCDLEFRTTSPGRRERRLAIRAGGNAAREVQTAGLF
jgi:hypothetical protein